MATPKTQPTDASIDTSIASRATGLAIRSRGLVIYLVAESEDQETSIWLHWNSC